MENTPDRTDASRAYEMESAQITPEECEQNAAHSCPQWRSGWNLAAVTIRAFTERAQKAEQELAALQNGSHPLQVQLREADCRAAKAEEELAALRAETAGLREAHPAAVYPDLGTAQGGPWVVQRDTNMRWAEADQPEIVIANFDGKHRELQPGPQGEVNIGGARYTVVEEPPKSCCTYCGKPDHD
jgi:hypothetical protein